LIVGKKGATINEIQHKSRAHILVPHVGESTDVVLIQGTPEAVPIAEKLIFEIVGSSNVVKSNSNAHVHQVPSLPSTNLPHISFEQPKIAEALFFPRDGNIDRILGYLDSCVKTLDVCVYTITDDRISSLMVKLHRRGVQVRVITDDEKSIDLGSDIATLSSVGIKVRMDNGKSFMHHKFAILDNMVLMTGSFNWTRAASQENQENIIFTNEKNLVVEFHNEFNRLWEQFKR